MNSSSPRFKEASARRFNAASVDDGTMSSGNCFSGTYDYALTEYERVRVTQSEIIARLID